MKDFLETFGKLPQSTKDSFQEMFQDETFARIMKTCFLKIAESDVIKSEKIGQGGDPQMLFKFLAESLSAKPAYTQEELKNLPEEDQKKIQTFLTKISSSFQQNEGNPDINSFLDILKIKK